MLQFEVAGERCAGFGSGVGLGVRWRARQLRRSSEAAWHSNSAPLGSGALLGSLLLSLSCSFPISKTG